MKRLIDKLFFLCIIFIMPMIAFSNKMAFAPKSISGITLNYDLSDYYSAQIIEDIKLLDRLISRNIFRTINYDLALNSTISLSDDFKDENIHFSYQKNAVNIILNYKSTNYQNSFATRSSLINAILLCRLGVKPNNENIKKIPLWISGALEQIITSKKTAPNVLRNAEYLPYLRYFLMNETLPNFEFTKDLNANNFNNVELEVFREFSRVLFDVTLNASSKNNNLLLDYITLLCKKNVSEKNAFDATIKFKIGDKLPTYFLKISQVISWNRLYSAPNALIIKKFDEFLKLTVPKLNDKGEEIAGETIVVDIIKLPQIIAEHPSANIIKKQKLNQLEMILRFSDSATKHKVAKLYNLIANLQIAEDYSDDTIEEMKPLIVKIKEQLSFNTKVDKLLDDAYKKHIPPYWIIENIVNEYKNTPLKSGKTIEKMLQETSKTYLEN